LKKMECKLELLDIELIWGIVDEGFGHRLVMASKDCGVGGRTILPGRRMVERHPLLDLFGLADEKEGCGPDAGGQQPGQRNFSEADHPF
jgi:hypothetical protein